MYVHYYYIYSVLANDCWIIYIIIFAVYTVSESPSGGKTG